MKTHMYPPIQLKAATPSLRNSISPATAGRGFFLIALALGCFALSPSAEALNPPPDGGYSNHNTAEGDKALFSLTTGFGNTAIGFETLYSNTTGSYNVANGHHALFSNTTGNENTANGEAALFSNTTGGDNTANGSVALAFNTTGGGNTANGVEALYSNTTGDNNTANGIDALFSNTTGSFNTANGEAALLSNTTGNENTANGENALASNTTGTANTANGSVALHFNTTGGANTANGFEALFSNTTGDNNTATGLDALAFNTTGSNNTANGFEALAFNTTGSNNIAFGISAGFNLTTGNFNIDIGNAGVAAESNTIRIGTTGTQTNAFIAGISGVTVARGVSVVIDANGHLGTKTSSERFKTEIKSMDKASEAILSLKPVTFRYKKELDPEGTPQFGLIAEQVEKVNPELVARDAKGEVYTVRYDAVNAMLLNEFIKEHRKVEELESGMQVLTARLKEQESQIQKVSAQLELRKPAPQIVGNKQ